MPDPKLETIASEVVTATRRRLPKELRDITETVAVHFEDRPGEDVLKLGFEPDLLGLFEGDPFGSEMSRDNPFPAQIILYLENLWDLADGDTPSFREEVRITYLHELGHYLGWDEDEVAARGLE